MGLLNVYLVNVPALPRPQIRLIAANDSTEALKLCAVNLTVGPKTIIKIETFEGLQIGGEPRILRQRKFMNEEYCLLRNSVSELDRP